MPQIRRHLRRSTVVIGHDLHHGTLVGGHAGNKHAGAGVHHHLLQRVGVRHGVGALWRVEVDPALFQVVTDLCRQGVV